MGLAELLAADGIEVPAGGMIRCPTPEHEDNTPSCSVHIDKGLWFCHGCGAGGDAVTYLERARGLDKRDALERVKPRSESKHSAKKPGPPKSLTMRPAQPSLRQYAGRLWRSAGPVVPVSGLGQIIAGNPGADYLRARFSVDSDFDPPPYFRPPLKPDCVRWLDAADWPGKPPPGAAGGLLFRFERWNDRAGLAVSAMMINGEGRRVERKRFGSTGGGFFFARRGAGRWHICEGELDALAILAHPSVTPDDTVCGAGGAGRMKAAAEAALEAGAEITAWCDRDSAGFSAQCEVQSVCPAAELPDLRGIKAALHMDPLDVVREHYRRAAENAAFEFDWRIDGTPT